MRTRPIKRAVACAFILLVAALAISNLSASNADAGSESEFIIAQTERTQPTGQQPQGQTPQEPDKKAGEVYKNIQVLKDLPASRLMGAMQFFARSLGVKCDHCHVPREFEKDEKPTKLTARKMYQMVQFTHKSLGTTTVSCFMCHRGKTVPEPPPAEVMAEIDEMMKSGEKDTRPAEKVYKNIQALKGAPAGRIMGIMTAFSKSLGVECSYCHDEAAFEKDDNKHKLIARQMITMVGGITKEFYQGTMVVNCYTCHRGQTTPVSMPPRPEAPKKDGN